MELFDGTVADNIGRLGEPNAEAIIAGKAGTASKDQQKSAGGTAVIGTGGVGSNVALSGEVNWLLIAGGVAVVVMVAGLLVLKARQNRERAVAYEAVAKVS